MKLKMTAHEYKGKLITFCGLDGSGKTTFINKISTDLDRINRNYVVTKQPTSAVRTSQIFRTYMDSPDHENYDYRSLSLLAASDRIQHTNQFIIPELKKGNVVLSDRYFYSCLANLKARGFYSDEWIYEIGSYIVKPDISLFFDIDVDIAIARVRERASEKDRYIDIELQHRLREQYLSIAEDIGGIIINTTNSFDACYSIIKEKLKDVGINV